MDGLYVLGVCTRSMYVASTQFGLVCMYVRMYVGCGSSFWGTVDGRNLPQSADLTARRSWLANNGWFGLCVEQTWTYLQFRWCNGGRDVIQNGGTTNEAGHNRVSACRVVVL